MVGKTNVVSNLIQVQELLFYNAYFKNTSGTSNILFNDSLTSLTKGTRYDEFFYDISSYGIMTKKKCLVDLIFMLLIASDTASTTKPEGNLYLEHHPVGGTTTTDLLGHIYGNRYDTRCIYIPDVEISINDFLYGEMITANTTAVNYAVVCILKEG